MTAVTTEKSKRKYGAINGVCRHCKIKCCIDKTRTIKGLCFNCLACPSIYEQYAIPPGDEDNCTAYMTDEELDRFVEKRRENLPDWWDSESERSKTFTLSDLLFLPSVPREAFVRRLALGKSVCAIRRELGMSHMTALRHLHYYGIPVPPDARMR